MKARDIVPGWPRGRSTSRTGIERHHPGPSFCCPVSEQARLDFLARWENYRLEREEVSRKEDMMEVWHTMHRSLVRDGFRDIKEFVELVILPCARGSNMLESADLGELQAAYPLLPRTMSEIVCEMRRPRTVEEIRRSFNNMNAVLCDFYEYGAGLYLK